MSIDSIMKLIKIQSRLSSMPVGGDERESEREKDRYVQTHLFIKTLSQRSCIQTGPIAFVRSLSLGKKVDSCPDMYTPATLADDVDGQWPDRMIRPRCSVRPSTASVSSFSLCRLRHRPASNCLTLSNQN